MMLRPTQTFFSGTTQRCATISVHVSDPGPRANCCNGYTVSFARTTPTCTVYPSHFPSFMRPTRAPGRTVSTDTLYHSPEPPRLHSVSQPFPVFHASDPGPRANCCSRYTVSFARTTPTCTVYPIGNSSDRLGSITFSVPFIRYTTLYPHT